MESPSPVPCPTSLVVKNGLDRPGKNLRAHARAGVADRHADIGAGVGIWVQGRMVIVDLCAARRDPQAAAARHCVAGINRKVEDRVLELVRIDLGR